MEYVEVMLWGIGVVFVTLFLLSELVRAIGRILSEPQEVLQEVPSSEMPPDFTEEVDILILSAVMRKKNVMGSLKVRRIQ